MLLRLLIVALANRIVAVGWLIVGVLDGTAWPCRR
jgi:hypothetical protein